MPCRPSQARCRKRFTASVRYTVQHRLAVAQKRFGSREKVTSRGPLTNLGINA